MERSNGQRITSAWFNELESRVSNHESIYEIEEGSGAIALEDQEFDGVEIRAVLFDFVAIRGTTVAAHLKRFLVYKGGAWALHRVGDTAADDDAEHLVVFTLDTSGSVAALECEAQAGPGDLTLIVQRRSFSAPA